MIAAACSGVALTGEVKQNQSATAAAVRAQVTSDAEMGKVTAGLFIILNAPQGYVIAPADVSRSFPKWTARRTRSVRDSNSADGNVWSG
jgi:hypothetical protein